MGEGETLTLAIDLSRTVRSWTAPLPPGPPVGRPRHLPERVAPLWELMWPGPATATFELWRENEESYYPDWGTCSFTLEGKPPDALATELGPLEEQIRLAHPGEPVTWSYAGPFFATAVRIVVPEGAILEQPVKVALTRTSWRSFAHEAGPDWRGHRTRWLHAEAGPAGLWWALSSPPGALKLHAEFLMSLWLKDNPFPEDAVMGGVPLSTWRALNRALFDEVCAELDRQWSRPIVL